jgi:UDP-glucose 4-epimerase
MKFLITGGAGFIGSHLVDLLKTKKNVSEIKVIDNLEDGSLKNLKNSLKNKKVSFFKKDIRNFNSIQSIFKGIDKVIHLAALSDVVPSIVEPRLYMENNINGTINVLESMRKYKVKKIVYAASSSCYGISKYFPTSEKNITHPKYPYAISKLIGEDLIRHWSMVYKINFVSLRLFNVYGTRSRSNSAYGAALGVFLKQKMEKKPFTIVGDGKQKRDFIYVSDVCDAFYKAAVKNLRKEILNIGFGKPRSVNDMVGILGGSKTFVPKRPGEPDLTHANISKATKLLDWKPKIKLEDGLKIVLKNINYWKDAPLWTPKKIRLATKDWFKYLK